MEQNSLDRHALDFETKKHVIVPAFIAVAEGLKIGLCDLIDLVEDKGGDPVDLVEICHKKFVCPMPDGSCLTLVNPSLSLEAFENVLFPFLDEEMLFTRETEYSQTLSIFVPILDALERCGLKKDQIDLCLLVGGSCLIPEVQHKLKLSFEKADMLCFENADATQMAVAKGAALNALSLALQDRPVIRPVCQETIAIITSSGPYDLVKRGDSLPWPPGGGYQEITSLVLPESSLQNPLTVRVEVVALEEAGRHILLSEMWDIPAPVEAGERIRLDYRYDENQVLDVRAFLADRGNVHSLAVCKEHPLTHISNPQVVKLRIEATEEKLRTGTIQPQERRDVVLGLAEDCAEIRQYEKAVSRLSDLLRQRNEPDAAIINRMGLYCGYMGDLAREEKLYAEASAASPTWSTPWFNMAQMMHKQKRFEEANHAIDMAIGLEANSAPHYVLKAQIGRDKDRDCAVTEYLDTAWRRFPKIVSQSDWELWWYITATEMRDDKGSAAAAREERSRRKVVVVHAGSESQGLLPVLVA